MLDIFVDADACPTKPEIYRVAKRYGLKVTLVANAWMRIPPDEKIELVVVGDGLDVADDWIAEHVGENDIVVSGDIPLAARCLGKGARVVTPRGRVHTEESIGDALANRELQSHLREIGQITGGPAPLAARDRSRLLQRLDELVQSVRQGR